MGELNPNAQRSLDFKEVSICTANKLTLEEVLQLPKSACCSTPADAQKAASAHNAQGNQSTNSWIHAVQVQPTRELRNHTTSIASSIHRTKPQGQALQPAWEKQTILTERNRSICVAEFKPPLCSDPPPCHTHTPFTPCRKKKTSSLPRSDRPRSLQQAAHPEAARFHPHVQLGGVSRSAPSLPRQLLGHRAAAITGTPGAPAARPQECYSESICTA